MSTFSLTTAIFGGALTLLVVYDILDLSYGTVGFGSTMVLCLGTICVRYLANRKRLNYIVPAIDDSHNKQNEPQQNAKLSRTLFVMVTTSLLF